MIGFERLFKGSTLTAVPGCSCDHPYDANTPRVLKGHLDPLGIFA